MYLNTLRMPPRTLTQIRDSFQEISTTIARIQPTDPPGDVRLPVLLKYREVFLI
jgi:hypothetical protein